MDTFCGNAQWIWLDPIWYPELQKNQQCISWPKTGQDCVADFRKTVTFLHFVMQAICEAGLIEEYGLTLFEKWKPLVLDCSKGLQEGWLAPEPNYSFDHSHAWGGTPAYHIPLMLSGFKMLEPGFKKISLSPRLLGLEEAEVSIPTPYGMIHCVQHQGEKPQISIPEGLDFIITG